MDIVVKHLVRGLTLALLSLLVSRSAVAQFDVAVKEVLPRSDTRLFEGASAPVTITVRNSGPSLATNVKVKVLIRTYHSTLLYGDSVLLAQLVPNKDSIVLLKPFKVPQTGYYAVTGSVQNPSDIDPTNDLMVNDRIDYQMDVVSRGIDEPVLDAQKLQKVSFPIKARFRSNSFEQEIDVHAKIIFRRCLDSTIAFVSEVIIPELPKDTVTIQQTFPSAQGVYDVRKLAPGCYLVEQIVHMLNDFDRTNDTARSLFNIQPHVLTNDLMVDTINAIKDTKLQPGQELTLTFAFGNVGKNTQPISIVRAKVFDADGNEVYADAQTLLNWISGETKVHTFAPFSTTVAGDYTLKVYTTAENDEYRLDDTLTRRISVGSVFRISADTILIPATGAAIAVGTPVVPRGEFTWTGNQLPPSNTRGVIVVRDHLGAEVHGMITKGLIFSEQSRTIVTDFTDNLGQSRFSELPAGAYTAKAYAAVNDLPVDSTESISFRLAHAHDVTIDSLISPGPMGSYPLALDVVHTIYNMGLNDDIVKSLAIIRDRNGNIVYEDSASSLVLAGDRTEQAYRYMSEPVKGMHTIEISSFVANETDTTNANRVSFSFHIGPSPYDPFAAEAQIPAVNGILERGQDFEPAFIADWIGADTAARAFTKEARIIRCEDNSVVYSQRAEDVLDQRRVFSLSSIDDQGRATRDLSVGCYKAILVAHHLLDLDNSDDTLIVPFTIQDFTDVAEDPVKGLQISQRGAFVGIDLGIEVTSAICRLFDINGRLLGQFESVQNALLIPMRDLPNGSYVIELSGEGWTRREIINYLR